MQKPPELFRRPMVNGQCSRLFAADILLGSAMIKRAHHCVNGLCTPFGSPVIGGQKRLGRMLIIENLGVHPTTSHVVSE
jgi:hypothetical protein